MRAPCLRICIRTAADCTPRARKRTRSLLASITDEVPGIPFRAFILVEPAMITRPVFRAHMQEHETSLKAVRYAVGKRKELWRSRAEARAYFEDRYPWQMWDPRTRELFVVSPRCLRCVRCCGDLHSVFAHA